MGADPSRMSTPFHSKYFAHELTRRCSSDNLENLSQSLNNVTNDLNPPVDGRPR